MPRISVVICTHNPRPAYLQLTLDALKSQTLRGEQWELLLVDNASKDPLSETYDLSWHPSARHIREMELGLTPARIRGIKESKGELLVFVDDDNVLRSDYLENAWAIAQERRELGVWGGSIIPRFEVPPPEWTRPHWSKLAIREVTRPTWSNMAYSGAMVCGAGMCLRAGLARTYASLVLSDPHRRTLDRAGSSMMSCGDTDIAMLVIDEGFGNGQFPSLELEHLIPASRLTEEYLLKLTESMALSWQILVALRQQPVPQKRLFGRTVDWLRSPAPPPERARFLGGGKARR